MSKAILGAVEIGAAFAATAWVGGVGGIAALSAQGGWLGAYSTATLGLAASGLANEMGAVAQALGSNAGMGVTTRTPAGLRQIIRGIQRVGGTIVYCSTTGSTKRQYNLVIVLATHVCEAIENLYLDGRQVFWSGGSAYNQTVNGYNFGGNADSDDHVGPNGVKYNFGGLVFCAAFQGKQTSSPTVVSGSWVGPSTIDDTTASYPGFCSALNANDGTWAPGANGTPYLAGCTYVYLKIEADAGTFPQFPEIRFTVHGKNDVYDPRTATTGYTANWALHIADVLANPDPMLGVGDGPITSWPSAAIDQLIAAANICDESVACAAGTEARYPVHYHYDSSTSPGDAMQQMMSAAMGRVSRIGGGWYIWPAAWTGPSFTFDENSLVDAIQWSEKRPFARLVNRVTGKYIAPNYPYNVAGNLYDSNGYFNGVTANNFPYSFQPTDFPPYAADELHGYGTGVDVYLEQDGGIPLPFDLQLPCVLSVSQAQRLAKIYMLRNRQQGTGTLRMSLAAFKMQPLDVMQFNFPALGWVDKVLEIAGEPGAEMKLSQAKLGSSGADDVPALYVEVPVNATDASVYEWDPAEELSPYDIPLLAGAVEAYQVQPPTGVTAESDVTTALVQADGTVIPRIKLSWTEPTDTYVTNGGSIEIQMCAHGSGAWQDVLLLGGQTTQAFLGGIVAGQAYDLQLRAQRANGAASPWVQILDMQAGLVISPYSVGSGGLAPGALSSQAFSGGTAQITVDDFTATVGTLSASFVPSPVYLTGLNQSQLYYVYFVESSFASGTITPIATQNVADFVGKVGYYLIGAILTASFTPRYLPSSYVDSGADATINPTFAYDGNSVTSSAVMADWWAGIPPGGSTESYLTADGACQWGDLPSYVAPSAMTLYINASVVFSENTSGGSMSATIAALINGTLTTLATLTASTAQQNYTIAVPSGTNLNTIFVQVAANITAPSGTATGGQDGNCTVNVFDVWVQ